MRVTAAGWGVVDDVDADTAAAEAVGEMMMRFEEGPLLSRGVGSVLEGAVLVMLEAGDVSVAFHGRILTTLLMPCKKVQGVFILS